MIANVLTDLFVRDFVEENSNLNSFVIEVSGDFVTVNRKHQFTSLIESKSIKVDTDVVFYLHEVDEDVTHLECKWLWREPTIFENLSLEQALELKKTISHVALMSRNLALMEPKIKGIQVGDQCWSAQNFDIDLGIYSVMPKINSKPMRQVGLLYTYEGAERIEACFPDWRIPTLADYEELCSFFKKRKWNELTKNMEFKLAGFQSRNVDLKELEIFFDNNPALKPKNGGFYWTSDIVQSKSSRNISHKRTYIHLNSITNEITNGQSVTVNDNMFSLRLIKK